MKWHSNLNRVMESGNHYKNGTSPKILMIWSIFILFFITMTGCAKEKEKEDDYSLYFSEYQSFSNSDIWNGWRIMVRSEFVFWYHFESNNYYSDEKTFFFTLDNGDHTYSATVSNIRPGLRFDICLKVWATESDYTVHQTNVSGSTMHYWIEYKSYSQTIKLWTDDMVVSKTLILDRQIGLVESMTFANMEVYQKK